MASQRAFHLLHADAHLLVLNKPSGLLAVPGRGPDKQDCLSARVQAEYPDALIVHRLDMDTSGLLIMARGSEVQRLLSMAFAARRVHKRYIAVVAGHLAPPATPDGWGLIDLPLIVDWPNRPKSIVDHEQGKPSQTRWRVLEHTPRPQAGREGNLESTAFHPRSRLAMQSQPWGAERGWGEGNCQQTRSASIGTNRPSPPAPPPQAGEGCAAPRERETAEPSPASGGGQGGGNAFPTTRLELDPLTGRSHQLRVHLQALGHPILGDPLYATPAVLTAAGRLLLHASHLAFTHPITGADLSFHSPPDF